MDSVLRMALSNVIVAAGLAVLALVVGRVWKRPAFTHALWLLVLLKLVTPPLWQIPISFPQSTAAVDAGAATVQLAESPAQSTSLEEKTAIIPIPETDAEAYASSSDLITRKAEIEVVSPPTDVPTAASVPVNGEVDWSNVLFAVWLAGTLCYVYIAFLRSRRFTKLLSHAAAAPDGVRRQVYEMATQFGVQSPPDVRMVPGPVSPMLWAFLGQARILLPEKLWQRLGEEQRTALLAHELAHFRRRDHWTRCLELLVTALYWWNPVVWLARREIGAAEEECCDAWVVWLLPSMARDYALALLETIDFLSEARPALPPAACGIGHVHHLRRRLSMIMRGSTPRSLSRTGVVAIFTLGCLVLPFVPTSAQSPKAEKPDEAEAKLKAELERNAAERAHAERAERTAKSDETRSPEDVEDAKDAVKLLQMQIEIKKAELSEHVVKMKQAEKRMRTQEKLVEGGGTSKEELTRAKDEVEIAHAHVQQKEAQLKEAMVRMEVAARRTQRIEGRARDKVRENVSRFPAKETDKPATSKASQDEIDAYKQRIKKLETMLEQLSPHGKALSAERARIEELQEALKKTQEQSPKEREQLQQLRQALEYQQRAALQERDQAEKARAEAELAFKRAKELHSKADPSTAAAPDQARMKAVESKVENLSREMEAIRKDLKTLLQRENEKK